MHSGSSWRFWNIEVFFEHKDIFSCKFLTSACSTCSQVSLRGDFEETTVCGHDEFLVERAQVSWLEIKVSEVTFHVWRKKSFIVSRDAKLMIWRGKKQINYTVPSESFGHFMHRLLSLETDLRVRLCWGRGRGAEAVRAGLPGGQLLTRCAYWSWRQRQRGKILWRLIQSHYLWEVANAWQSAHMWPAATALRKGRLAPGRLWPGG